MRERHSGGFKSLLDFAMHPACHEDHVWSPVAQAKALTETGLIDRRDYGVVPPKVEYRLTRKGKSFVPVIAAIRDWGARHLARAGPDQSPIGLAAE
jgi:hypothetical protein